MTDFVNTSVLSGDVLVMVALVALTVFAFIMSRKAVNGWKDDRSSKGKPVKH